jgi:hypothetical protein
MTPDDFLRSLHPTRTAAAPSKRRQQAAKRLFQLVTHACMCHMRACMHARTRAHRHSRCSMHADVFTSKSEAHVLGIPGNACLSVRACVHVCVHVCSY